MRQICSKLRRVTVMCMNRSVSFSSSAWSLRCFSGQSAVGLLLYPDLENSKELKYTRRYTHETASFSSSFQPVTD